MLITKPVLPVMVTAVPPPSAPAVGEEMAVVGAALGVRGHGAGAGIGVGDNNVN
jgi:hypothetical protein